MSTLSKGPVAPSDKLGRSDYTLIMRSCAMDGRLLQGDKPAMAIETSHTRAAFGCRGRRAVNEQPNKSKHPLRSLKWSIEHVGGPDLSIEHPGGPNQSNSITSHRLNKCGPSGEVWATYTRLSASPQHAVVLSVVKEAYPLELHELELGEGWEEVGWIAYEANTTSTLLPLLPSLLPTLPLRKSGKWDFEVWALAPWDMGYSGFALIGEQGKWVPASSARFSNLELATSGEGRERREWGAVTARGMARERVDVTWAWGMEVPPQRITVECVVGGSGYTRIRLVHGVEAGGGKAFHGYCDDKYVLGPLLRRS